jgi:hypothetical protein
MGTVMGTVKLVKDEWLDDWLGFLKEVKSDIVGEYGHVFFPFSELFLFCTLEVTEGTKRFFTRRRKKRDSVQRVKILEYDEDYFFYEGIEHKGRTITKGKSTIPGVLVKYLELERADEWVPLNCLCLDNWYTVAIEYYQYKGVPLTSTCIDDDLYPWAFYFDLLLGKFLGDYCHFWADTICLIYFLIFRKYGTILPPPLLKHENVR